MIDAKPDIGSSGAGTQAVRGWTTQTTGDQVQASAVGQKSSGKVRTTI